MSTSDDTPPNEPIGADPSSSTSPVAGTDPVTRTAVLGRTKLRNATVATTSTLTVPLTRGHDGELHLCIVAEGRLSLLNRTPGEHELHEGDCFVVLDAQSVRVRLAPRLGREAEIVRITVPGLAIEAPVRVKTGAVIRADRVPMTSPVLAFARKTLLMDLEEASSLSIYYLERLAQEMAIGILVDNARSRVIPQSPTSFTVAQSVISAQCADANLRPATIAEQVGLSLRQLQRIFADHDTTIDQEIRRERVEQAIEMLSSPAYAGLSVTKIARYVGFSNGSGLARAMNALGHLSPRQVRILSGSTGSIELPARIGHTGSVEGAPDSSA